MNVHQGDVAVLAAQMRRVETCPSCGSREAIAAFDDNDISAIDELPDALRHSDYVICGTCALVFASWRQTPDAITAYYALFPELEDRTYGTYPPPEDYRQRKARNARRIVKDCEDSGLLTDGIEVLHIRADCGSLGPAIRERVDGCTIVGCDYFGSNIRWANESGAMECYQLDPRGVTPPSPGRKFDLIAANHVLTHALDLRADLTALADMLRPGGHVYAYNEIDSLQYFRLGYRYFKPRPVNNYHKQLFSPETLARTVHGRGFVPLRMGRWRNRLFTVLRYDPDAAVAPVAAPGEVDEVTRLIARWVRIRRSALGRLFRVPAFRALYKLKARAPADCRVG